MIAKPGRGSGFQFKQFFVEHDKSAMKVSTDSIMLGSWAIADGARHVLDVGTGSGLLAIMLAQKTGTEATIDAIDIDAGAIQQAQRNVQACPWPDKICISQVSLQDFSPSHKFDLIISNPPYFSGKRGSLAPTDAHFIVPQRRLARHTVELEHAELFNHVSRLLSGRGKFCCVLPATVVDPACSEARQYGLSLSRRLNVKAVPRGPVKLVLLEFSSTPVTASLQELTIRDAQGKYTPPYIALCGAFYLKF